MVVPVEALQASLTQKATGSSFPVKPGTEVPAKVEAVLPNNVLRLSVAGSQVDVRVSQPLPEGTELTLKVEGSAARPEIRLLPAKPAVQTPLPQLPASGGNASPSAQVPAGSGGGLRPNPVPILIDSSGKPVISQPPSAPPSTGQPQTLQPPQTSGALPGSQSGTLLSVLTTGTGSPQTPVQQASGAGSLSPGPVSSGKPSSTGTGPVAGNAPATPAVQPGPAAPPAAGGSAPVQGGSGSVPANPTPQQVPQQPASSPGAPVSGQAGGAPSGTLANTPASPPASAPASGQGTTPAVPTPPTASGGQQPTSPIGGAQVPPPPTGSGPLPNTVPSGAAPQAAGGATIPGQGQPLQPGAATQIPVTPTGAGSARVTTSAPPSTTPALPKGTAPQSVTTPSLSGQSVSGQVSSGQGASAQAPVSSNPAAPPASSGQAPLTPSASNAPGLTGPLTQVPQPAASTPANPQGVAQSLTIGANSQPQTGAAASTPAASSTGNARPTPSPEAVTLAKAALPKLVEQQASLSGAFAQLASLGNRSALGISKVPEPVQSVVQQLLGLRLGGEEPTGKDIQSAVKNSGVFREAILARGQGLLAPGAQSAQAGQATGQDIKSLLLQLRSFLKGMGIDPAPQKPLTQPPVPSLVALPRGQRPSLPNSAPAGPDGDEIQQLSKLLSETDAALSRIRLTQMVSRGMADDGMPQASGRAMDVVIELPITLGQETGVLQMQVGRDPDKGKDDETAEPGWRLRFALDLTATGPLEAAVSLRGGGTYVSLWMDRSETFAAISAERGTMEATFAHAGLDLKELRFLRGLPQKTEARFGVKLDRTS